MKNDFGLLCNRFLYAYMYELEELMMENIEAIKTISFHSDEANTDRPLKEFVKELIENRFNRLSIDILKKNLIIKNTENKIEKSCEVFRNIYIKHVYIQEELTEELKKQIVNRKNSVYTNPDLLLELTDGVNTLYFSVEVKSTKNDSIPGSSIQQINPNEWVIFVKHSENKVEVATGKYINSINNKLRFPDRSPRPQVSFNEIKKWNSGNRLATKAVIEYSINAEDTEKKQFLLKDWQNYLADKWLQITFEKESQKNEPWFNNCLRKFVLKFVCKYEELTATERKKYKETLNKQIKD